MLIYEKINGLWKLGEVITPQKLNDISNALKALTEELYNATDTVSIEPGYENNLLDIRLNNLQRQIQFNSEALIENMIANYYKGLVSFSEDQSHIYEESDRQRARANIGAPSIDDVVTYRDDSDENQQGIATNLLPLSTRQKNARKNIDAVGNEDFQNEITQINSRITQSVTDLNGSIGNINTNILNINSNIANTIGEAKFVKYTSGQQLGAEEKTAARQNIGAAADDAVVMNVQVQNSELVVTKKNATNRFPINVDVGNTGLSFDSGAFVQETVGEDKGKYFLHLYLTNEETELKTDIANFTPFVLPDATLPFDTFECREVVDEQQISHYYIYAKKNEHDVPKEIFLPFEIIGGGGGGGGVLISLSNVNVPSRIRNGADANFSFVVTTNDGSPITIEWYVNNQRINVPIEYTSNDLVTFNAKDYLIQSDTTLVQVKMTSGGTTKIRSWNVISVDFSVAWPNGTLPIMVQNKELNIVLPVNVYAPSLMENILTLRVNSNTPKQQQVTGTQYGKSFTITPSLLNIGKNIITCYLVNGSDNADRCPEINLVILYTYNLTTPVIAFSQTEITAKQYETVKIPYFAYTPDYDETKVTIIVGNTGLSELYNVGRTVQNFDYTPLEEGNTIITLQTKYVDINEILRTLSTNITVKASKTSYNLLPIEGDSKVYTFDPTGHSNSELNRKNFGSYQNTKIIFDGNTSPNTNDTFDWINGGFQKDGELTAFVVKKGHYIQLPISLFQFSDVSGKTIDLSFKITNSDDYFATALTDISSNQSNGLILKSNQGELYLNSTEPQVFRYCEDERIDLSINIETEITNHRLLTIWLDGIPSYVNDYVKDSLINDSTHTIIGSLHCDIWIYNIRVYNVPLTERQMVQNYISNGINLDDKIQRFKESDIYTEENPIEVTGNDGTLFYAHNEISLSKLRIAQPNLTIVSLEIPRMTTNKDDNVPAAVTIIDENSLFTVPAATSLDPINGCVIKVQGTTSRAYGRSSFNLDVDFRECAKKPKYKISENSIPVNYLNIKVNVASSENANNICAVDWYNSNKIFITLAEKLNPQVRDTMEGKPCAIFITNTSSLGQWFSSQWVAPGKTILYAMGDICNSKKNVEVFGEDGTGDHPTKCCIEISDNTTDQQCFTAISNYDAQEKEWGHYENNTWKTDYEWRMKPLNNDDLTTCVNAWDQTVAWLASVKNDPTEFKAHFEDYFIKDTMLYHFLFIEYFAAYDNVSKNTFYSFDYQADATDRGTVGTGDTAATWGKYRWTINKAYDWDTILACNNDGAPLGDYGLDYGDLRDNTSAFDLNDIYSVSTGDGYFNAMNSIWVNIYKSYSNELRTLYARLRNNKVWDSELIATKWDKYQNHRPHATMVRDAYVKYIYPYKTFGVKIGSETHTYDKGYLVRMNGSKTYQRRQFLTYQTSYMDGKYGFFVEASSILFRTNSTSSIDTVQVKSYAKTYIGLAIGETGKIFKKVETGGVALFNNIQFGSNNTTVYLTPARLIQYIKPINTCGISTFGTASALKLTEATLGDNIIENRSWFTTQGIAIPSLILKILNIENISTYSLNLDLSQQIELTELNTEGTKATNIILGSYAPLNIIKLNDCTGFTAKNIISNILTCSISSVARLSNLIIENCSKIISNTFKDKMINYLVTNKQGDVYPNLPLLNARITNIDWYITDRLIFLLDKLLLVKGIDVNGNRIDTPCILTGTIHVRSAVDNNNIGNVSSVKLIAYNNAWSPNLTIECNRVEQYTVGFYDWDGRLLQNIKIFNSGLIATSSDFPANPDRDPDEQYTYTFTGWLGMPDSYNPQNRTFIVTSNLYIRAKYNAEPQNYTITWYDDNSKTHIVDQITNAHYGLSYEYSGPALTKTTPQFIYLFKGWDKSTAFITGNTEVCGQWVTSAKVWQYNPNLNDPTLANYTIPMINGQQKTIKCVRQQNKLDFNAADVEALAEMSDEATQQIMTNLNALGSSINIKLGYDCNYNINNNTNLLPGQIKSYNLIEKAKTFSLITPPILIGNNVFNFFNNQSFTLVLEFSPNGIFTPTNNGEYGSIFRCVYKDAKDKLHGIQICYGPRSTVSSSSSYNTSVYYYMWDLNGEVYHRAIPQGEHNIIVLRYNHLNLELTLFARGDVEYSTSGTISLTLTGRDTAYNVTSHTIKVPKTLDDTKLYLCGYKLNENIKCRVKVFLRRVKLWEGFLSDTDCRLLAKYPRWDINFIYSGYGLYRTNEINTTKLSFIADVATDYGNSYSSTNMPISEIKTIFNNYYKLAFPLEWQQIFTPIQNAFYPIESYEGGEITNLYTYSYLRYDLLTNNTSTTPRILLYKNPNPIYPPDENWDQTRIEIIKPFCNTISTGSSHTTGSSLNRLGTILRCRLSISRIDQLGQNLYFYSNYDNTYRRSFISTFSNLSENKSASLKTGDILEYYHYSSYTPIAEQLTSMDQLLMFISAEDYEYYKLKYYIPYTRIYDALQEYDGYFIGATTVSIIPLSYPIRGSVPICIDNEGNAGTTTYSLSLDCNLCSNNNLCFSVGVR